jgi:ribosome-binding protein aMBF1 (putative translation factor)
MATKTAADEINATDDLIRTRFEALKKRKAEIEGQSAPIRAKRQKLHDQQNDLGEQIDALTDQINSIERPEVITLSEEISKLARVLGGKAMSDVIPAAEEV